MTDADADSPDGREATLRELAGRAREHDDVTDAFVAKSFTDLLVVVDLEPNADDVPAELVSLFESHGCYGANEVYDQAGGDRSSLGTFEEATRHQFVDTETRGEHQSYVVD